FYFQAEDDKLDDHVTGVQTCALPIFGDRCQLAVRAVAEQCGLDGRQRRAHQRLAPEPGRLGHDRGDELIRAGRARDPDELAALRSEERRVGKRGRTRSTLYRFIYYYS